jgi:hypothetical protein
MTNINNFYKLNTAEDSTHIHKTIGLTCLINFGYRYFNYFMYGTMNLENILGISLILIHGLLSVSSLIFHIPGLRNPLKPMIYPEFRLHSITFALRSVIISLLYYYKCNYLYVILTCYLTMIAADIISNIYNESGKNGKTMRNMPFDNTITLENQQKITSMHSYMQIGATTYMLGNIETAFSPLFAIQLAAFLMTLVRKSIISAKMWHSIYSLSLWINIILFLNIPLAYILFQQIVYYSFKLYFFPKRINKYISWSLIFGLFITYKELNCENILDTYIINYLFINYLPIIYYFRVLITSMIFISLLNTYKTLFIYK